MNVYDGERMAELLGDNGMTAAADGDDADLVVLNTCHIREKAAEKAYSDVGRLKREDGTPADDRARRLRRPGRGRRGAQALADDRHRRRPAGLSPPARAGRRGRGGAPPGRHRHAGDLQVRRAPAAPPRGPERLPHRPGRLRQILHLLRRALHPRRRDLAALGRHRRRGACAGRRRRARDHPARPERQRLERRRPRPRRADPRARQDRWARARSATPPATPPT